MSQTTFEMRRQLTNAIGAFETGNRELALAEFKKASSFRPGINPIGVQDRSVLEAISQALPNNLTARIAHADCLPYEEALPIYISVVRDARPRTVAGYTATPEEVDEDTLENLHWHSIDLGAQWVDGLRKNAKILAREMLMAELPDLRGKSVLDIGAFGGWFSFEAERRGAAEVTALEYYSWVSDFPRVRKWVAETLGAGKVANAYDPPPDCIDIENQPGRLAFDIAHKALGSRVRPWLARFEDVELSEYDVVLMLGVLYHNENPFQMLEKIARATKETLVLETHAATCPSALADPTWHFFGAGEVRGDGSTFWAPSEKGLADMLKRVGFSRVEILYGWDMVAPLPSSPSVQHRMWVHAHK